MPDQKTLTWSHLLAHVKVKGWPRCSFVGYGLTCPYQVLPLVYALKMLSFLSFIHKRFSGSPSGHSLLETSHEQEHKRRLLLVQIVPWRFVYCRLGGGNRCPSSQLVISFFSTFFRSPLRPVLSGNYAMRKTEETELKSAQRFCRFILFIFMRNKKKNRNLIDTYNEHLEDQEDNAARHTSRNSLLQPCVYRKREGARSFLGKESYVLHERRNTLFLSRIHSGPYFAMPSHKLKVRGELILLITCSKHHLHIQGNN